VLSTLVEAVLKFGVWIYNKATQPFKELQSNEGLRRENIESFLEHRSVSEYLNYVSAATDDSGNSVYMLKDGRYGIFLQIDIPSFPSNDVEHQLATFLKSVDEDIDVVTFNTFASQNLEQELKEFLDSHPCEVNIQHRSFLKKMIYRRYEYLRRSTRESLFPKIDFRIKNYICTIAIIFNEQLDEDDVFMRIESIKGATGAYHSQSLPPEVFVSLLREFFFNDKGAEYWNNSTDEYTSLDKQITRGGLRVNVADERHPHGFVMNDNTFVTVMTTKKFPPTIDFDEMDALFVDRLGNTLQPHIRGPYYTSLVLDYRDNKKVQKNAMAKAQANYSETLKHSAKDLKKRPHLKARKQEAIQTIEALESGKERAVPGQWTLVLYDNDIKTLNRSISSIRNSFASKGWEIIPETFGHVAFLSALHALPLQLNIVIDEFLKRKPILFERSNHAPIIPLIGESRGYTNNKHIPWISRTGQLQWFDPKDSDSNYNISASGTSGAGKSYTVNDIILLSLGKNYVVRVIDSLPSYKKTTTALGGQYEEFVKNDFCFNFFTNILLRTDEETGEILYYIAEDGRRVPQISQYEYSTIIPMLGSMIGANLFYSKSESNTHFGMTNAYLSSVFEDAIRVAYEAKGNEAGLKEIYQYIGERYRKEKNSNNLEEAAILNKAYNSLKSFGDENGVYFKHFNGANNIDIHSDFATFELTRIEGSGVLYPLALMSIANKISTEFFNMENSTRGKLLIIEEFWKYIDMEIVLNFSIELSRKVRKAGGVFMPVTQGIDDYFVNEKMKAIYDNCAWQFILKNKPSSIDNAVATKKLTVNPYVASLLKKITPKKGMFGEFALMEGNNVQFSRLRTDGISHYLFTTKDSDELAIQKKAKELNISYQDAIVVLGIQRDNPDWPIEKVMIEAELIDEDAIKESKELSQKRAKEIKELLEKTLELSNFIVEDRIIYDREGNEDINILRFPIKDSKHDYVYFDEYAPIMQEMEISTELTIYMLEKATLPEYAKYKKVGIVLSLEALVNNKLFNYAADNMKAGKHKNISFIVDLSLKSITEDEEIEFAVENWAKLGVDVSVKRYDYFIDNELVLKLKPKYVIIDASRFTDDNKLATTVKFAKVVSDDVVLINSQKISPYFIDSMGINYKDTPFGNTDGEEELLKVEALDV